MSPPALLQAQAHVNANVAAEHQRFLEHVGEGLVVGRVEPLAVIKDLRDLLLDVFGWQAGDLVDVTDPRLAALEVVLSDYHETLRPTFAAPDDPRAAWAEVEPWADAGCTWGMETRWEMPQHSAERIHEIRKRIAAGPPRRP